MESQTEITEATKESFIAPLQKVTTVSKYLALFLFISLPILGIWLGYVYSPSKVVTIQPSSPKIEKTNVQQKPEELVLTHYRGSIGMKNVSNALNLASIAKSLDNKKIYYVRLPYEGAEYSQLLVSESFAFSRKDLQTINQNLGLYAVSNNLFINPNQRDYYSATSGAYWLPSTDGKQFAVVYPDTDARVSCMSPEMGNAMGVNNTVGMVDLESGELISLRNEKRNPFVGYEVLEWIDASTLKVLKRSYEEITPAEYEQKYGGLCSAPRINKKMAGKIQSEEELTLSITDDFVK